MADVTDAGIIVETLNNTSQPGRKNTGRAHSGSMRRPGKTRKQSAPDNPPAPPGQENPAETPDLAGTVPADFPSPPADLSSAEAGKSAKSERPGRTRAAAGKSADAKKLSHAKKEAAPSPEEASALPASGEMPPPADVASTPEQPAGNKPAEKAPRKKKSAAGPAKRARTKTTELPAEAGELSLPPDGAEAVAEPAIPDTGRPPAVTWPGEVHLPIASASPAETVPARTGTIQETDRAGIDAPDTDDAPETVPAESVVPSAEGAPETVPVDLAVPGIGAASATAPTEPVAPDAEGVPEMSPAGIDALNTDDAAETTQAGEEEKNGLDAGVEDGRRRRRSRRGGRGRRKNTRAGSANNGSDTDTPEATLPLDAPDTSPVATTGPDAPADAIRAGDPGEDGESAEEEERASGSRGKARRKMYVSVLPGEQVEVVITEEGLVQEYYVEMLHQAKTKGNIYKGVVHNVDANLQAAFVGYGAARNGFLQIDEIHPEYYVSPHDGSRGRKYPLIQKVLKPGQEVLVQVVKEPAGTKGAFLTTYLSMPGRFLVLTPGREQVGVSRKVEDDSERARLRELLEGLNPGPGLGVIVRTVSMGASKTSLQRDLQFLKRTWKEVRSRGTSETAPCMVYQEMDLTARAVRDYLNESIGEVRIDDEETAAAVTEVAEALFPRRKNLVRVCKDPGMSLFERFNIQRQLDQIHSREVALPSGGRLVIDSTEALTAIDINSGRSGGKSNFEDLAYRTNIEAAAMIPLQLRLRDIGGQIVADFIEMRDRNHWREVEKTLRNGMKVDRARYDVGKISSFGLLEMVRQRLGSSAISVSTESCPFCNGTGVRRNMEWRCQHALRDIRSLMRNAQGKNEITAAFYAEPELALHLLNHKRKLLAELEQNYGVGLEVKIRVDESGS
jgi:ribonuclease E